MPSASLLSTAQIETIVRLIKEVPSSQGLSTAVHLMLWLMDGGGLMASGSSSESDATPATTLSARGAIRGASW